MDTVTTLDTDPTAQLRLEAFSQLYPHFAERANGYDSSGGFVYENYEELRKQRLFSSIIPIELGGGGIDYVQLANIIKNMSKACGSTALCFSMHCHSLLLNLYKYLQFGDKKAQATLEKVATKELVIATTGANDWLHSSGEAVATEGGYRVNAHKRFVSGGPGAQVFVTSAIEKTDQGDDVLHFSIPFATQGIEIKQNWDTLGMRGTGSNDVIMTDVFVPESAIVTRRPSGEWHPMWDMIIPIALPLIVSCYFGLAEQAAAIAIDACQGKNSRASEIGQMNNQLNTARLARNAMVECCRNLQFTPSLSNTDAVLSYKTITNQAIIQTVNTAANLAGGAGFFKGRTIERIIRDVRALHFHPLPETEQKALSGRLALGLQAF